MALKTIHMSQVYRKNLTMLKDAFDIIREYVILYDKTSQNLSLIIN